MKLFVLFCFCSNLCFSQKSTFDSIYLNIAFEKVSLTEDQKSLIVNLYKNLRTTDHYKSSGEAQIFALNQVNLYAHSLLSHNQKMTFDSAWEKHTLNLIHSYHHHLNLTPHQKERVIAAMRSVPGFDSLQIINYSPAIPKDTIISLLDDTQQAAEAIHQDLIKRNFERSMAQNDSAGCHDAVFEKRRVEFIRKYYAKHLQKEHKIVLNKLKERNLDDATNVALISNLYQERVQADKTQQIRRCYSSDSVIIAPIKKESIEYQYARYSLQPNLCVYWCKFGSNKTPEMKAEEKKIMSDLESIQQRYPDIINPSIQRLQKHKMKLNRKVEQERPVRKGTVVSIVSDKRTEALEGIAELLLIR